MAWNNNTPYSRRGGSQNRPRFGSQPSVKPQPAKPVAPTPATVTAKPAPKQPLVYAGPADLWQMLQSVRDPNTGSTKTTRAMIVPGGVLINTCTRSASAASEACVFIPGATLLKGVSGIAQLAREAS